MHNLEKNMKRIIAVRHAESMGNAGLATSDPGSNSLTQKGRSQAMHAAQIISTLLQPELFIVSKYIRTQQTLEPLVQRFPTVPIEVWDIHEFCMLNPTYYQNTRPEDRKPHALQYWEDNNPLHCNGGEAECFVDFVTRIEHTVHKLRTHSCNNIVLFSHAFILLGINFLKDKTNFKPLKDENLEFQKKVMREFRNYSDVNDIANASPYILLL
jgi:broad specificity phosphatase PhoE